MKSRKRIGIILAVIGAILAIGLGAYVYMTAQQAEELAKQTPTIDVVVAIAELPERAPIPAASVTIMKVPAYVAPTEAATQISEVVGKYPLTPVYKNEVIIKNKLADDAGRTGPAFALKPGMVAVTYAGSDLLNSTGAVRVGDRVDMLLSLPLPKTPGTSSGTTQQGGQQSNAQGTTGQGILMPMVTQTFMQNLEVIRVGGFPTAAGGDQGAAAGKAITFQVSHQDALILKWAKDAGGVIDLALRHPSDKEPVDTEAITGNYVFKKFKFVMADPIQ